VKDASDFDRNHNENSELCYTLHNGTYFLLTKIKNNHRWEVFKTIQDTEINNPICLRSLQMEFEIGSQLRHSGIVHYYQFNALEKPQLKREFIDGAHWLDFFKMNPSESKNIKRYFEELLSIIKYLHLNGVYHMDIKSENILITHENYQVKIIDFGHAIQENGTLKVGGTKHYQPAIDNGYGFNDVYALGKLMELTANITEAKRKRWIKKTALLCMRENKNKNALILSTSFKRTPWIFFGFVITFILGLMAIIILFSSNEKTAALQFETIEHPKDSVFQTHSQKQKEVSPASNLNLPQKVMHTVNLNTVKPKHITFEDSLWIIQNAKTFGGEYKRRYLLEKNQKANFEIYSILLDEYEQKWKQMEIRWQDSTQKSVARALFLQEISLSLIPYQSYLLEE
jgi:serine/threonine protein kinase